MTTYTIPKGTPIWRTLLPVEAALARLSNVGALTSNGWVRLNTTRAVTYTDADLLTTSYSLFYYFRLPAGAHPYTLIEVERPHVEVQTYVEHTVVSVQPRDARPDNWNTVV